MVQMQPVRAKIPRRRALRARVGVLEDVRGAAGGGQGSTSLAMTMLGNGLSASNATRTRCPCREAELSMLRRIGAPAKAFSPCRAILRERISKLGRFEEALLCGETYTLAV